MARSAITKSEVSDLHAIASLAGDTEAEIEALSSRVGAVLAECEERFNARSDKWKVSAESEPHSELLDTVRAAQDALDSAHSSLMEAGELLRAVDNA